MYRLDLAAATIGLAIILGACAGSASKQAGAPRPGLAPAAVRQARWTGHIRPRDQQTGEAMFAFSASKYEGSVTVSRAAGDLHQTSIEIMLSSSGSNGPSADSRNVSWGLVVGRCGTAVAPVLPVTSFAPVELSSNGRGELSWTIPFDFPTSGEYHIDIYAGRSSGLPSVIACADLRLKNS